MADEWSRGTHPPPHPMKGIVFNLLEQFASLKLGEARYEQVRSACPLMTRTPFEPTETYPFEDLLAILKGVVEALDVTRDEVLREFGLFSFPKFAGLFPAYVVRYPHPKEFLLAVDSIIHAEVGKRFKGASPPRFTYKDPSSNRLVMEYHSQRGLCSFMEGLIQGVAEVFKSPIRCKQTRCRHRGDPACEFDLRFSK
jgi:hypothetical protein